MIASDYYAVVMAGGQGTRLWPFSRRRAPKQSLKLTGDRSLFQETLARLPGFPPDRILVATTEDQAEGLREQAPLIPEANFLLEPMPKGTAPVVGWAAQELVRRSGQAVMACLPSDHMLDGKEQFTSLLEAAYELGQLGYLVTLGIPPSSPSTGYGYIERGTPIEGMRARAAFQAKSFREKPGFEQAEEFLRQGSFLWNSGMFVWRADRLLEEIDRHLPGLSSSLKQMMALPDPTGNARRQLWSGLERQTLDYGIMEKADRVAVLPATDLGWIDVGSWDRLFEVLSADAQGNVHFGEHVMAMDSARSLFYQVGGSRRLVAALGLEDMIIVDTGEIVLICARSRAEEVRRLVDRLSEMGWESFE